MHRFFVPPTWIKGDLARLEGAVARQVRTVLRMSPGDELTVLDGTGREYLVRLTGFARDQVEGSVLSWGEGQGEARTKITLYQALLKGERFRWVLQKGTELGVAAFVPLICHRSILKPQDRGGTSLQYDRWCRIVTEAAEQSARSLLPQVRERMSFHNACDEIRAHSTSIIPWEREGITGLRQVLRGNNAQHVNLFIGPEGGFEEEEVAYARDRGVIPVSLGRRVLRSETASIATVAAVLYEAGELSS